MLNTRMLFKNVTVEGGQTHDLNKFGKLCTLPRLEPRTQKCALPRGQEPGGSQKAGTTNYEHFLPYIVFKLFQL